VFLHLLKLCANPARPNANCLHHLHPPEECIRLKPRDDLCGSHPPEECIRSSELASTYSGHHCEPHVFSHRNRRLLSSLRLWHCSEMALSHRHHPGARRTSPRGVAGKEQDRRHARFRQSAGARDDRDVISRFLRLQPAGRRGQFLPKPDRPPGIVPGMV
jgi:hypothetical protein